MVLDSKMISLENLRSSVIFFTMTSKNSSKVMVLQSLPSPPHPHEGMQPVCTLSSTVLQTLTVEPCHILIAFSLLLHPVVLQRRKRIQPLLTELVASVFSVELAYNCFIIPMLAQLRNLHTPTTILIQCIEGFFDGYDISGVNAFSRKWEGWLPHVGSGIEGWPGVG
eukprot:TRINITY_DN17073_c0_g1_i10.p1 TRINITY_DN17073_c0_g1~~TRINITY_DN17073_c0_g1_i10.p1  ORF type:complete len:167 (-),score=6.20 TRINITY_DN17073_c0_g1_i10:103-603(-)